MHAGSLLKIRNRFHFTEAGRELADPAGVAALAIRRMSPFWFFLELWDLWQPGTGSGPGGGGQTSLKLMDGRSLAPVCHSCPDVTFGSTLAPSWRTGLAHFCSILETVLGLILGSAGIEIAKKGVQESTEKRLEKKVSRLTATQLEIC